MKPLFNQDHSINLPGYVVQERAPPSLVRRALALVIDIYLGILIFLFPFNSILMTYMPQDASIISTTHIPFVVQIIVYFFLLMLFFYMVCMQYFFGQTIGMMFMRYEVVSKNDSVQLWQSFVRNLFAFPLLPLSFVWMIDIIYYMFYGIRLLERLSNTHVSLKDSSQLITQVQL